MEAVSENEAFAQGRFAWPSNDPSQAAQLAAIAAAHQRIAARTRRRTLSAGRRRCTNRPWRPPNNPSATSRRTRPPGSRRAPAGCAAPVTQQASAWAWFARRWARDRAQARQRRRDGQGDSHAVFQAGQRVTLAMAGCARSMPAACHRGAGACGRECSRSRIWPRQAADQHRDRVAPRPHGRQPGRMRVTRIQRRVFQQAQAQRYADGAARTAPSQAGNQDAYASTPRPAPAHPATRCRGKPPWDTSERRDED